MRKSKFIWSLLIGLLLFGVAFSQGSTSKGAVPKAADQENYQGQKFMMDKPHTYVGFVVSHMVLSKVRGKFQDYDARFLFNEKDVTQSYVEVRIKAASIDTDNAKRDKHLRSDAFLNVREYPEIVFKSKRIEKSSHGYIAYGDLTIRGITKEIALPFELSGPIRDPMGNIRVGVEGQLTINQHDFGVSWNKTMDNGGLVVGNDVKIEIQAEFVKASQKASIN